MKVRTIRVPFDACPLCESDALSDVGEVPCKHHPLWSEELGESIAWRGCTNCGHVFTEGYFGEEALEVLFGRGNAHQTPDLERVAELESERKVAARMVRRVSEIRGELGGSWLDVGFGSGSLLATAEEFGYEPTGLDLRRENVERMRALGYRAECLELERLDEPASFDVISMADVLEHMPFPRRALQHVHRLLRPAGLVFISLPNMDCLVWRQLDTLGQNPYWAELEHYHNFGRDRLYALLAVSGFEPCDYMVSERYRACMEIIARKVA